MEMMGTSNVCFSASEYLTGMSQLFSQVGPLASLHLKSGCRIVGFLHVLSLHRLQPAENFRAETSLPVHSVQSMSHPPPFLLGTSELETHQFQLLDHKCVAY